MVPWPGKGNANWEPTFVSVPQIKPLTTSDTISDIMDRPPNMPAVDSSLLHNLFSPPPLCKATLDPQQQNNLSCAQCHLLDRAMTTSCTTVPPALTTRPKMAKLC